MEMRHSKISNTKKEEPKFERGDLVKTYILLNTFYRGDFKTWSHVLYTITKVRDDKKASYYLDFCQRCVKQRF